LFKVAKCVELRPVSEHSRYDSRSDISECEDTMSNQQSFWRWINHVYRLPLFGLIPFAGISEFVYAHRNSILNNPTPHDVQAALLTQAIIILIGFTIFFTTLYLGIGEEYPQESSMAPISRIVRQISSHGSS
jgi:hypothetical protein